MLSTIGFVFFFFNIAFKEHRYTSVVTWSHTCTLIPAIAPAAVEVGQKANTSGPPAAHFKSFASFHFFGLV